MIHPSGFIFFRWRCRRRAARHQGRYLGAVSKPSALHRLGAIRWKRLPGEDGSWWGQDSPTENAYFSPWFQLPGPPNDRCSQFCESAVNLKALVKKCNRQHFRSITHQFGAILSPFMAAESARRFPSSAAVRTFRIFATPAVSLNLDKTICKGF